MNESMWNDFIKFNKAIDDLIAQGMSEDEALDKVSSEWTFEGVTI